MTSYVPSSFITSVFIDKLIERISNSGKSEVLDQRYWENQEFEIRGCFGHDSQDSGGNQGVMDLVLKGNVKVVVPEDWLGSEVTYCVYLQLIDAKTGVWVLVGENDEITKTITD